MNPDLSIEIDMESLVFHEHCGGDRPHCSAENTYKTERLLALSYTKHINKWLNFPLYV